MSVGCNLINSNGDPQNHDKRQGHSRIHQGPASVNWLTHLISIEFDIILYRSIALWTLYQTCFECNSIWRSVGPWMSLKAVRYWFEWHPPKLRVNLAVVTKQLDGRHMISSGTIFWNDENVIRRPNKSANQRRNPLTIRTIQSVTWSRRQLLARQLMDQIFVSLYLLGGTLAISKICVLST